MGLRTVTLEQGSRRLTLSRDGWRKQVETTLAQAAAALRQHDLPILAGVFGEVGDWDDEQRAYQAWRQITELAFAGADQFMLENWVEVYALFASRLLARLERNPAEPILLNYLGVLLYELGEAGAAEALFTAAGRLDPELENVEANRQAARRRRAQKQIPLPGPIRLEAREAARRAERVALRAKPLAGQTISLVMIVKNEEEMLPGCLEAVAGAVDEIVIVDTGSTDRTVEIAESFGATVVPFPWNGSFSDARNCSIDHATSDWIVYLDADEHVVEDDAKKLRELIGKSWREAFYLVETNYTGGDDSGSSVAHLAMRVFKRRPDYRFEGRIHEQKTQSMPTYLPERFETSDIRIRHYGYLKSVINAKDKSRRNIELLEAEAKELPGPFVDFNLGSEYMALGEFATARTYLDRAWDLLRREDGWSGRGYSPMLAARVAQSRREDGDTAGARLAIEEGLGAFPDHTELVLQAAMCAKTEGDLDEAARLAERCLGLGEAPTRYSATVGSGTYLATCLLAQIRTEQGRPLEAEELYRSSLEGHSEYVAPVLTLAASMLARDVEPAEVSAAIGLERPSAKLLLATALYEAGHAADAEGGFRSVLEHQPGHSVARIGLVETLLAQRRYDEAATEAAKEPDNVPLTGAAMVAELFARAAGGGGPELAAALARAPRRAAGTADIALYTAWAARLVGGDAIPVVPAEAAASALTALEALLRVREFKAFESLAGVYESIDLPEPVRRCRLAQVYFRRGFLDSAADEWIAAYQASPEAAPLVGLAQVAIARGLDAEARELAYEAVAADPENQQAARLVEALARKA